MSEITQELIAKIKEKISLGHYQTDESFLLVIIPIIASEIRQELEESCKHGSGFRSKRSCFNCFTEVMERWEK